MTKFKENLIAFIIAIFVTGGVILALGSSGSNVASDLLGVKKISASKNTDIVVNVDKDSLKLVSQKNIDNLASISLELLYDKDSVSISRDNIDSNYSLSLTKKEGGNGYVVILGNVKSLKKGDVLLLINNISKSSTSKINFGHIQLITNNGDIIPLTIKK